MAPRQLLWSTAIFLAICCFVHSSPNPSSKEEGASKADSDYIREQFMKVTVNQTYMNEDYREESAVVGWTAPDYFERNFPFYLSGYDYEDRPLWVVEIGKYDFRDALERGREYEENLEKWILKMSHEFYKSRVAKGVEEIAIIFDFEGFTLRQFGHLPSLAFMIRTVRKLSNLAKAHLGNTVIVNGKKPGRISINWSDSPVGNEKNCLSASMIMYQPFPNIPASYLTRTFVDLVRPIWGRVFDNVEVFGTNKDRWIAQMRAFFPPASLPPWYGGKGKAENYKPLKTFG